jgi:polar amino acid transport system substrate-binding protein
MKQSNLFSIYLVYVLFVFVSFKLEASEQLYGKLTIAAPISDPFVFNDNQGAPQGFLVELFALVQQKLELKVNITVMPWARGIHEVKVAHTDALMPTIYTDDRAQFLSYPKSPIIEFNTVLLKRSQDDIVVDDLTQLDKDKTIAKIRGMSMGKKFDDAEKAGQINVIEVRDFDQAIQMLATSRVDLVACIDYISNSSLKRLNLRDKVETLIFSNEKVPAYLAFSKAFSKKHDVDALMHKINTVKNTPEYQTLVSKYLKIE